MVMVTTVFLLAKFFRLQETGNAFRFPVIFHVAGILETVLVTQADVSHHVIKTLDDVEGIDAIFAAGKVFFAMDTKPLLMSQQKYFTCFR